MEKIARLLTHDECVKIATLIAEGYGYSELGKRFGVVYITLA